MQVEQTEIMETDCLKNGEVYIFFKTNGKQKCVEFLTEKKHSS